MTSRIWLRLAAVLATLVLVLLAARASRAQDTTRTGDVTIHILATSQGTGEILECG